MLSVTVVMHLKLTSGLCAAILVYKTLSGTKRSKKLVHMSLQAIAFLLALVGIWAALKFHLDSNIDNFYSLHSWLGIFTVVLFFIQVRVYVYCLEV